MAESTKAPFAEPLPISPDQAGDYSVIYKAKSLVSGAERDVTSLTERAMQFAASSLADTSTPIFREMLATRLDDVYRSERLRPIHPTVKRISDATLGIDALRNEALDEELKVHLRLIHFLKNAFSMLDKPIDKKEIYLRAESAVGSTIWEQKPGFVTDFHYDKRHGYRHLFLTRWHTDQFDANGQPLEESAYRYTIKPVERYQEVVTVTPRVYGVDQPTHTLQPDNPVHLVHLTSLAAATELLYHGVKDKVYKK